MSGAEGLIIASGHYRNGILLGPITGKLIAGLLTGDDDAVLLAALCSGSFPYPNSGGWHDTYAFTCSISHVLAYQWFSDSPAA
jgi:glycine/D-amino acid oxidase-like deaminating enzyme